MKLHGNARTPASASGRCIGGRRGRDQDGRGGCDEDGRGGEADERGRPDAHLLSSCSGVVGQPNEGTRRGSGRRIRLRLRDREGLATVSQA